jgi:predicted adenylyl cyclase CyaB
MPRNLELKAKVRDWEAVRDAAERLAGGPPERILQVDTFFHSPRGRLKLREFSADCGELIYYERPDTAEAKLSRYQIVLTDRPGQLCRLLADVLGVRGVVRKERWLYLVGQTRIHLDRVEGLGDFLELEVVLTETQSPEDGRMITDEIKRELHLHDEDLLERAYIDLMSPEE